VSLSKEELEARVKRLEDLVAQLTKQEAAARSRTARRHGRRSASFVRPKAQPEDRR